MRGTATHPGRPFSCSRELASSNMNLPSKLCRERKREKAHRKGSILEFVIQTINHSSRWLSCHFELFNKSSLACSPLKNCKRPPFPDLADPFSGPPPPLPLPLPLDGGELQSEDPDEADDGDEWLMLLLLLLLLLMLMLLLVLLSFESDEEDEFWSDNTLLGSPIFAPNCCCG